MGQEGEGRGGGKGAAGRGRLWKKFTPFPFCLLHLARSSATSTKLSLKVNCIRDF